jgi:hypothetical protein
VRQPTMCFCAVDQDFQSTVPDIDEEHVQSDVTFKRRHCVLSPKPRGKLLTKRLLLPRYVSSWTDFCRAVTGCIRSPGKSQRLRKCMLFLVHFII